ncbi:DUF6933 domain-containing protein [Vibrio rarus]|uniref:DUF6933 domain-containing protein n=1 Tax=Vibrio rarus TaxID=413403 RepID=UPI0021C4B04B|nr:hypothetical protein [Vibrio rarus]
MTIKLLVFNCTKAAAEFFTVTRHGQKESPLVPAPHKTIQESVQNPIFPSELGMIASDSSQWHWVLHCVSIKRKKYLMVMDYESRFCITLLAGAKGDIYQFLNTFEPLLKTSFHSLAIESGVDNTEIELCIEYYDREVDECVFHPRGDRSVQAHLNDVYWHLERQCHDDGMLIKDIDLLGFSFFTGQFPRNSKHKKSHFFPSKEFVDQWRQWPLKSSPFDMSNVVDLSTYKRNLNK